MIHLNAAAETGTKETLQSEFYASLTAPLDGMREAFIQMADTKYISVKNQVCGFYALNQENELMSFFLSPAAEAAPTAVFEQILNETACKKAFAGTNEPLFLSCCTDRNRKISPHDFLFSQSRPVSEMPSPVSGTALRPATENEAEEAAQFYAKNTGGPLEWLRMYVAEWLGKKGIYFYKSLETNNLIATLEVRKSNSRPKISDLGMVVGEEHRRKGIGTYLLIQGQKICAEKGIKAICSCEVENTASRKAIEKAGFFASHRILEIEF